MAYRILYKKVFESEKETVRSLKELDGKATSPKVTQGKSGGWLIVLYESDSQKRIEEGMEHYKSAGLTVFLQKVG